MLPGEFVGEVSIIDNLAPTAYVAASEDSLLLCIHETVLWSDFFKIPGAARNMLTADRWTYASSQYRHPEILGTNLKVGAPGERTLHSPGNTSQYAASATLLSQPSPSRGRCHDEIG